MENFQYSVQLSDQDWAEFSAAAEECGLLHAGLASGDELLSSDTDQQDSSGSSPPGPPPLVEGQLAPRGSGWPGLVEEDKAATRQLVSRSWHEPVLALAAGEQTPSTSTRSEAWLPLGSGAAPPVQSSSLPVSSRDETQRLMQEPAPRGTAPTSTVEPPRSSESPGLSTVPQRPHGSPGAAPRSPSRKKRRAAGGKGSGPSSSPGSTLPPLGGPLLTEARPEEGLSPAGTRGKGLPAGMVEQTAGARQIKLRPESAGAPEQVGRQGPGVDLSTPVLATEPGANLLKMTPRAEPYTVSLRDLKAPLDVSVAKSDVALSTPASQPQPDLPLSTPASQPQPDLPLSTPASQPQPDLPLSTPASKPRLDVDLLMPDPEVRLEVDSSSSVSKTIPCTALPHLVSEAGSDVGVSTPAPIPQAGPDMVEAEVAPVAQLVLNPVQSPWEHQEKLGEEPSAGAPGHHTGETHLGPVQAPKKKKVRFSMAGPSPEEPGPGEAASPPSPATAPRTAAGGRRGSGAWDAVAVGPRSPQPRILKHLPPPAPSASGGPGPRSCFAVTLPEAYEFFLCDTIHEEDEDAEGAAEACPAPADVQWPEVCEFFFQDCRAQRSGRWEGHSLAPPLQAEPVPVPPPGDPMPISIPEAYEHFLGEDRSGGVLGPAALLQMQAMEAPRSVSWGVVTGTPPEFNPATAEQLNLAIRQAEEPRSPLTSFTFSQNDMCLVFVAFATWAVRTSDLQAPDAWKTVLLANIGTISAIRYFRRQAGRERPSPSPSPSS